MYIHNIENIYMYTLRNKGANAVTGAVPFQKEHVWT